MDNEIQDWTVSPKAERRIIVDEESTESEELKAEILQNNADALKDGKWKIYFDTVKKKYLK